MFSSPFLTRLLDFGEWKRGLTLLGLFRKKALGTIWKNFKELNLLDIGPIYKAVMVTKAMTMLLLYSLFVRQHKKTHRTLSALLLAAGKLRGRCPGSSCFWPASWCRRTRSRAWTCRGCRGRKRCACSLDSSSQTGRTCRTWFLWRSVRTTSWLWSLVSGLDIGL